MPGAATAWETVPSTGSARPVCGRSASDGSVPVTSPSHTLGSGSAAPDQG